MLSIPYTEKPAAVKKKFYEAIDLVKPASVHVCIVTLSYYIPAYDIIVSVLMDMRFEDAGSVRGKQLEVLPMQIYMP